MQILKTIIKIVFGVIFCYFVLTVVVSLFSSGESSSTPEEITLSDGLYTEAGQTLRTEYFDVTLHYGYILKVLYNNRSEVLKAEEGSLYLILNITFKNIDTESRMLTDGEVLTRHNETVYRFDKAETVMLEGWSTKLDQINPLTSKTTRIVFKIPTELKGDVYYRPGRSDKKDLILIGNLEKMNLYDK